MTPKAGYIFGLKIGYKIYKKDHISISPYIGIRYEQNKMGRSNINNISYTGTIPYYGNLPSIIGHPLSSPETITIPVQYLEPSDQYNQLFLQFGIKIGF